MCYISDLFTAMRTLEQKVLLLFSISFIIGFLYVSVLVHRNILFLTDSGLYVMLAS